MKEFVICMFMFLVASPLLGQENYVNEYTGLEWNGMKIGQKTCIIAGIWMGQTPSSLDTSQPYEYRYAENMTVGDYITELDTFYSKPKHGKIKILDAYVLATIKLRDDDSDDYEYVLKLILLDNKRLPNHGKVVRVIDGDSIEIEENNTKWEIRLFGIDAPEINHDTQTDKEKYGMKAKQFVSALCLGKSVKLTYWGDYFDKYGKLYANIKLNSDDNYLSQYLLKYGLAKPYPYHDPKKRYENTKIEKIYELWQANFKQAQGNKSYICGDRTYPYVEKMIREFKKTSESFRLH